MLERLEDMDPMKADCIRKLAHPNIQMSIDVFASGNKQAIIALLMDPRSFEIMQAMALVIQGLLYDYDLKMSSEDLQIKAIDELIAAGEGDKLKEFITPEIIAKMPLSVQEKLPKECFENFDLTPPEYAN